MKVLTLVGTRPEIIKLSRTIAELEKFTNHILVHTGQNFDFELNEIFFKELEIKKPNYFLDAVGKSTAETIGNVITKLDKVLAKEKPDAFVIYGDTNSCLGAIAARRRLIPIFHLEAGNRAFDQRIPEEMNRKIIDHTSNINLTLTEHARRYLIAEGIRPETVIKIGSPMKEIFNYYHEKIEHAKILETLKLAAQGYFLVSAHREENIDNPRNFSDFLNMLELLAKRYQKQIIVSTHPRTRIKLQKLHKLNLHKLVSFTKPQGFFDYVKLEKNALCVISDSGTITEESSLLGFPAITIRQAHERPEGMDEGTVIMAGLEPKNVLEAIRVTIAQKKAGNVFRVISDCDVDNVSKKVLRIILSYTDYINRTVWYKNI